MASALAEMVGSVGSVGEGCHGARRCGAADGTGGAATAAIEGLSPSLHDHSGIVDRVDGVWMWRASAGAPWQTACPAGSAAKAGAFRKIAAVPISTGTRWHVRVKK